MEYLYFFFIDTLLKYAFVIPLFLDPLRDLSQFFQGPEHFYLIIPGPQVHAPLKLQIAEEQLVRRRVAQGLFVQLQPIMLFCNLVLKARGRFRLPADQQTNQRWSLKARAFRTGGIQSKRSIIPRLNLFVLYVVLMWL